MRDLAGRDWVLELDEESTARRDAMEWNQVDVNESTEQRETPSTEPHAPSVDSEEFSQDLPTVQEPDETDTRGEPHTDVGFFLSLAGRYPLLNAQRERELATVLWHARRRLYLAIELARRSHGGSPVKIPASRAYRSRRISPESRRRLIAAEDYAERLLRIVEGRNFRGERFDRSLSLLPPAKPITPHKRRWLGSWTPPLLHRKQVVSIAPILREQLGRIRAAREELVQHNLRLVVWVAKGFRGRGLELVDLIQEGCMGLIRAIDRFDPAVGTRFSTFATHWIRQGIGRALAEKARPIRIPLNRLPEVRETLTMQSRLARELRRPPTIEEIAERMEVKPEKLRDLMPALSPLESIDAPVGSGDIQTADTLADEEEPSPLHHAIEAEEASSVRDVLQRMPDRHRTILAMRYGIGYPRECTLEEIGDALGLSRERIRQIEKVAQEEFKTGWNGRRTT